MRGIKYGYYHTYTAWGLYLKHWEITPPTPRRHAVTIPGRHGKLDVSKALTGEVLYENRTITATFVIMGDPEDWAAKQSTILAGIHGNEMKITIDDDPDYYYEGCVEVSAFDQESTHATITIKADVYPFKFNANGGKKL